MSLDQWLHNLGCVHLPQSTQGGKRGEKRASLFILRTMFK